MIAGERGFTLLEILVVLALLGLLLPLLFDGWRFGLTAMGLQARLSAHDEDLVVVDRVMSNLIGQAVAGTVQVETPFVGDAHHLHFTTLLAARQAPSPAGLADVSIGVDRQHRLVVTWLPHYAFASGGVPPARVEVLAEAIDHVDIDYYSAVAANGAATWRQDWTQEGLPLLVRLHLVLQQKAAVKLPDIIAQTRLRDRAL